MAAFERRPLSGSAFLFPAEFATAFLSPNTAFRCGQIFRNGGFPPFGIRGVFRVYFLFFEIGRFRHVLKPLSLVLRRGAIIAFLGHYQRLLVRGTYAPFIWFAGYICRRPRRLFVSGFERQKYDY